MNTLEDAHKIQFEILQEVKRVCDRYHLQYYLSGGTLLGAVRHKGFIPWDDDIDICMPLKDYLKFKKIANKRLKKNYMIHDCDSDPYDWRSYYRIIRKNTTFMDPERIYFKGNQSIFIDCFPIIYLNDGRDLKLKRLLIKIANVILEKENFRAKNKSAALKEETIKYYGRIFYQLILIVNCLPYKLRKGIHNRALKIAYGSGEKNGKKYWTEIWGQISDLYPVKELEGEPEYLEFEGDTFPCFNGYKEYLTIQYGNYMELPPVEQRKSVTHFIMDCNKSYTEYIKK